MKFNLHFGQMRPAVNANGQKISGQMRYLAKSPKRALMMANVRTGEKAMRYDADRLGNIEVVEPQHIETMRGLGYPIYVGDGTGPVTMTDMLWPHVDDPEDPYLRKMLEQERNMTNG